VPQVLSANEDYVRMLYSRTFNSHPLYLYMNFQNPINIPCKYRSTLISVTEGCLWDPRNAFILTFFVYKVLIQLHLQINLEYCSFYQLLLQWIPSQHYVLGNIPIVSPTLKMFKTHIHKGNNIH
jgi:hypothetical protein